MNKQSVKVTAWRRRWKRRIIEAMGDKCAACGYDRSEHALQLHHLDPKKKEISFSFLRSQPMAAHKQEQELKKCVLVCSNCHYEIHAGILGNPAPCFDLKRFRELIKPPSSIGRTPLSHSGKTGSVPVGGANTVPESDG
jgi:hypothetical protein